MLKLTIKKMTIYALLTSILFVQEQALSFLPNIQLTFFLIILYTKVLGRGPTIIITTIHVFLDCLFNGSFTPIILFPMFIGLLVIPITLGTFFKNMKKPLILASFGILYSICYSLCFTITNWLFLPINIKAYIVADIPFVILLSMSSFLSILLLYQPVSTILNKCLEKTLNQQKTD